MFKRFSKRRRLSEARTQWQTLRLHHIATPDVTTALSSFWETVDPKDLLPITALHRACTELEVYFKSIDELMKAFKRFSSVSDIDDLYQYVSNFPDKTERVTLDDYWGKHAFEGTSGNAFIESFIQCIHVQSTYNQQSAIVSIDRLCETLMHDAIAFSQALLQPEVTQ